jgi:hypothetical protein
MEGSSIVLSILLFATGAGVAGNVTVGVGVGVCAVAVPEVPGIISHWPSSKT